MTDLSTRAGLLRRGSTAVAALLVAIALHYALSTLFAVWCSGWSEMYKDQFWQYYKLSETPFPENLLLPDSQHRQVLSHLLRLADMHLGQGDQRIVLAAGVAAMAALLALLWTQTWRSRELPASTRAAISVLAAIAVCWTGAARIQFHGNDAPQVYLIISCALLVIVCVERLRDGAGLSWLVLGLLAATVAAFSFASGLAVFGLLVAMAVLRRLPLRLAGISTLATAVVASAYLLLMPGGEAISASIDLDLRRAGGHGLAWLSSFWTTAWLSYADAGSFGIDAAAMQGLPFGAVVVATARAAFALTGHPSLLSLAVLFGAVGVVLCLYFAWRLWRAPEQASRIEVIGLGLAVFALGDAVLVALGRTQLFDASPTQVLADRYVPWSTLFWCALGMVAIARGARSRFGRAAGVMAVLLLAALVYPSQRIGIGWAVAVEREIEWRAVQLQTDVYEPAMPFHCAIGNLDYVQRFVALLREQRIGMFRTPRSRLLGQWLDLPADAPVPAATLAVPVAMNAAPGWRLQGGLLDPALRARGVDGLLVVDVDGRVVGLGEFSHRVAASAWGRVDAVADGFDALVVGEAACRGLRLYGSDDAGTRFQRLADVPDCPAR